MQSPNPSLPTLIRFGVFEADLRAGELRKSGVRIRMQEQPFQILTMLLERPAEVVTREELQKRLWPADTFVDFEHGVNSAVARLREALGDSADSPRYIETLPRRGYRFIASVDGNPVAPFDPRATNGNGTSKVEEESPVQADVPLPAPAVPATNAPARSTRRYWMAFAAVALALALAGVGSYFHGPWRHPLTETDSIVLADVVNSTTDPVFDSTLRQALSVKLSESPFLSVVSEERMRDTLRFMARPPDEPLTKATAREVCQRLGSKALLTGQIAQLGDRYSIVLEADSCATGDSLIRTDAEATRKEDVLRAIDNTSADMRRRLGESLPSIQQYDVPIKQATTSSLDALKAFSLGDLERNRGAEQKSIPLFQHAIELDPNFAMAYAVLGQVYANVEESALSVENTQKAFERRDRASAQENLYITSHYYANVTHDFDEAFATYEMWKQTYPRDVVPRINLAGMYSQMGEFDKALAEAREAAQLDSGQVLAYGQMMFSYLFLNRLDEAKFSFDQAIAKGLDTEDLHVGRYLIGFLENDRPAMDQQLAWAARNSSESSLLGMDAVTAAYGGRLRASEALFQQAEDSARSHQKKELAANLQAFAALTESELGHSDRARRLLAAAPEVANAKDFKTLAALTLARAGDVRQTQALVKELSRGYPGDRFLHNSWLPTIQAQLEISRGNAGEAIRLLQSAIPYDMCKGESVPPYFSVFVRGEAYLLTRNGKAAEAEFQKILDHRSIVENSPHGALAHLGLARAKRLQGDVSGSRMAYQDFFALWNNADPDIPVLQKAKAEYAALK